MTFLRSKAYFDKRFHPKQEEAWLAYKAGLNLVLPWGRRSGKSDLVTEIFIEDVEETGYPSLYTAISQKQARRILWPKLHERLRHERGWKPNETRLEYIYKGGPFISLKGADLRPDDLAGGAYRLIGCDELALWKKPEIRQKILAPMLADYNGQFIDVSTKRGKNHFFKLHQFALEHPEKCFVNESTMFDNPFISVAGREKVISEYPGGEQNPLYRQEILNEYVVFEGMVFALPVESYTEDRWQLGDLEHSYHWRGMDHGYSPDPTACVWIAYNRRKGCFQIYGEYKQAKLLIHQHADVINSQETAYRFRDTYSDIDPQVLAEYENVGLSLTPANKRDKKARLLRLVNALRTGKLKIARHCTQLLDEMASLTWEDVEKATGDDHLIDASDYGFNNIEVPQEQAPKEEEYPRRSRGHDGNFSQSFGYED